MNTFVKEQLMKVQYPIPSWDDSTTSMVIPKRGSTVVQPTIQQDLVIGRTYHIKIENYILNPPDGFTLAANWNGGTNPPEQLMKGEVIQLMGKMIRFNLVGDLTGQEWEGWLPRKGFSVL